MTSDHNFLHPKVTSSQCLFVRTTPDISKILNLKSHKTEKTSKFSHLRSRSLTLLLEKRLQGLIDYQKIVMINCGMVLPCLVTQPDETIMDMMIALSKADMRCTWHPHCDGELTALTLLCHCPQLYECLSGNFTKGSKPWFRKSIFSFKKKIWLCVCCFRTCCQWCSGNLEDWKKSQWARNNSHWLLRGLTNNDVLSAYWAGTCALH